MAPAVIADAVEVYPDLIHSGACRPGDRRAVLVERRKLEILDGSTVGADEVGVLVAAKLEPVKRAPPAETADGPLVNEDIEITIDVSQAGGWKLSLDSLVQLECGRMAFAGLKQL